MKQSARAAMMIVAIGFGGIGSAFAQKEFEHTPSTPQTSIAGPRKMVTYSGVRARRMFTLESLTAPNP